MICRTCQDEFDPKERRTCYGYIDQCDDCGRREKKEPDRIIGRRGEKGIGIEIFKTRIKTMKSFIRNENRGVGPIGLNLNSTTAPEKE